MYRWVSYVLLISLLRLQFVCCCGSLVHLDLIKFTDPQTSHSCCVSESKDCGDADEHCHHEEALVCAVAINDLDELSLDSVSDHEDQSLDDKCHESIEYKSLANRNDSHRHHLHVLHSAKVHSNSKVTLDSLVVTRSLLPETFDGTSEEPVSRGHTAETFTKSGRSILVRLGQLRI